MADEFWKEDRPASEAQAVAQAVGPLPRIPVERERADATAALAGRNLSPRERAAVRDYQQYLDRQKPDDRFWEEDRAAEPPSLRETLTRAVGRGAADLAAGFGNVGTMLLAPYDIAEDVVRDRTLGTGNRERQAAINEFAKQYGMNNWTSVINQAAPELAATGGPIAGVEKVAAAAAPRVIKRLAGMSADVGTNAAYSAAQAAARGEDPGRAALWGAAGSAGGRLLSRTLAGAGGRVTAGASDEANELLRAGITPTYGQALGPTVAKIESTFADFIPGVGASVDAAKRRAVGQYAAYEAQRAVEPLGVKLTAPAGRKAVEQANQFIDAAYESLKARTVLAPLEVKRAAGRTRQDLGAIPLLTDRQAAQVRRYYEQKISKLLGKGNIDGFVAKDIDREIGDLARRYSTSSSAADHSLGEAFYKLRENLRAALQGTDPQAVAQLRAADEAFRNMIPVNDASRAAIRKGGLFDAVQFSQQGGTGAINEAALDVLDTASPTGLGNLLKRSASIGTTSFLTHPLAGAAVYAGGRLASSAVYSDAAIRSIIKGMNLLPHIRTWVAGLPASKQREFVERMWGELGSQGGRVAGQQEARE